MIGEKTMNMNDIMGHGDVERELIEIRRTIHENPCVSGHEEETVKYLFFDIHFNYMDVRGVCRKCQCNEKQRIFSKRKKSFFKE